MLSLTVLPTVAHSEAVDAALSRRLSEHPESVKRRDEALLAAGIEAGDRQALRWLLGQTHRAAKARRDLTPQVMAEVAAQAAELIATGASPRIRTWSGTGPLAGWVQVVTLRLATAVKEKEPRGGAEESLAEKLEAVADAPELAVVKRKYRGPVSSALATSLERLDDRQRSLLRMHHLESVSLEALAKLHKVHRATVARWLAEARQGVLDGVRDALMGGQGVGRGEVDSVMMAVHTGLELSLRRLLQS